MAHLLTEYLRWPQAQSGCEFGGQYPALFKLVGDKQYRVTCRFKRNAGQFEFVDRECEPVECVIDVQSFWETDAVDHDGARQAARHLEKIAKSLDGVVSGFRSLSVNVIGRPEVERDIAHLHVTHSNATPEERAAYAHFSRHHVDNRSLPKRVRDQLQAFLDEYEGDGTA